MTATNPQPTLENGGAGGREEAAREGRGLFDPPLTFDSAAVEKILTAEIRQYLDDPPHSARGKEENYYHHLAWHFVMLRPWVTEEECRRTQFAADLIWDLEHDRESLIRRLPAFLIPRHRPSRKMSSVRSPGAS